MEAEHFAASGVGGKARPWNVVNVANASSAQAIKASTGGATTIAGAAAWTEYRIDFNQTGTHFIWVRARSFNTNSDSLFISFDGGGLVNRTLDPDDGSWNWHRSPQSVNVGNVGTHTIRIYRHEANVEVDKLVVTPSSGFLPTGTGPSESAQGGGANAAPQVTITAPADGAAFTAVDTITFAGTASDVEEGVLTAGLEWSSNLAGSLGAGGTISTTLTAGTQQITAAVTDAGGATGQASISVTVTVPGGNTAPQVAITAPESGASFTTADTITFAGTASDAQEGVLTASLRWSSNLAGALGTGGTLITALTAGTHTITASVTDSGGLSGAATISITVAVPGGVQYFPGAAWETRTPAQVGLNGAKLAEFAASVGGIGTIVKDGYVVSSWGDQTAKADWASAAKPMLSTLLLFAISEGRIDRVDDPVADWVTLATGGSLAPEDESMTFWHLANMVSGYARAEGPGEAWAYNDTETNLYGRALEAVFGGTLNSAALSRLAPLQLQDGSLFTSRSGLGISTSTRDFARIAWFWLNRGNWNGTQIIPASLFEQSMQPQVPNALPLSLAADGDYLGVGSFGGGTSQTPYGPGIYGMSWWFNGTVGPTNVMAWPDAPIDTIQANGHWGLEMVVIIPSLNMVVANRGNWGSFEPGNANSGINRNLKLLGEAAAPSNGTPVANPDSASAIAGGPPVVGNVLDNDNLGDAPSTVTSASQGAAPITVGGVFTTAGGGRLTLLNSGSHSYTPPAAGTITDALVEVFNYTLTDSSDRSSSSVLSVTVAMPGDGTFQDGSGLVSMEAEHFSAAGGGSGVGPWSLVNLATASNVQAIKASTGGVTTTAETSSWVEFRIDFSRTGTHYIWFRGRSFNTSSDSLFISFDGGELVNRALDPDDGSWNWHRSWQSVNVGNIGTHTIRVYRREANAEVDKLVVTSSSAFVPTGTGPPESARN